MRKLLNIIICLAFTVVSVASAQNVLAPEKYFSPTIAEGVWELDPAYSEDVGEFTCDKKPLKIIIDVENSRYVSTRDGYRDDAEILEIGDNVFWIRYDDEQRLDAEGNPVEWAWILIDEQHFYWIRRDWLEENGGTGGATLPRRRCPQPEMIS